MKSLTKYTLGLMIVLINCNWSNKNEDIAAPADGKYKLVSAFPNLEFVSPIELTSPDDNTDRIFVVGQKGTINVFQNKSDVKTSAVFLDITSRLIYGGERGLLGLAFHPNYKSNGYFYVNYTRGNPLETVISRFKVSSSNPNMADPNSELVLLKYSQPYENHNGGKVAFGNDGYLYIA
ncbi:MAG TPA: glucose sorbosone dehydrogenase, partial [Sphingobacteriaceae bacterium]|nr:glucose sorbosone dehydrogenase [Sphingobacteriaceae bacterium]